LFPACFEIYCRGVLGDECDLFEFLRNTIGFIGYVCVESSFVETAAIMSSFVDTCRKPQASGASHSLSKGLEAQRRIANIEEQHWELTWHARSSRQRRD
jgi:hypothetical protein